MTAEIAHLRAMQIAEVEKLQREKSRLTHALEMIEREVAANPAIKTHFTAEEKEEYRALSVTFSEILKENQRHLFVAREINAQIVGVIRESRIREESTPLYTQSGANERNHHAVHLALNDVI